MGARRGVAALEFALCFPVFLAIVGGVVELSMFVSFHHVLARAARDGARVGSITIEGSDPTGALIEAEAEEQAEFVLDTMGYPCEGGCDVDAEWAAREDGYHYITVSVSYPYRGITGLVPYLDDTVSVGTFTMLTQQQDESAL